MKIRKGFVSNSSSSSFVAWGMEKDKVEVNDDLLLKYFEKNLKSYEKNKDKYEWAKRNFEEMSAIKSDEEKIKYFEKDEYDIIDSILETFGFDVCYMDYSNFFGLEISTIMKKFPDAKIKDMPELVAQEINKVFGTNFTAQDMDYSELAWRDG